jgi:hypothetical protein
MSKRLMAMLLWCGCLSASLLAQDAAKPFTKEEVLRKLKPVPGQRSAQGDLAGEISQRGINFPVDEKTLEEFRLAGARSFVLNALKLADPSAPPPAAPPPAAGGTEPAPGTPPPAPREPERPSPEEVAKWPLLEQARFHAAEYTEELPNFIVTQFVTRSVRTPQNKDWQLEDKLEIELSYHTRQGEKFKLLKINDKPTQQRYEALRGATSTGEFGSMLAALFARQSQADFKEIRRESFRNLATVVYEFRVKKAFSNNQLTDRNSGRSVTTAYSGTVWIEVASGRAVRIEQSSEDIQRGFPITLAESAVEYDWVTINDTRYLLPVFAEVILGNDGERHYSRNLIELRNYKVFETDMKIVP